MDGVRAASMSPGMRRFMRAMPFVMFPFIVNFPAVSINVIYLMKFFAKFAMLSGRLIVGVRL